MLVVTPLRLDDSVSRLTLKTVLDFTKSRFCWYTYSGKNNVMKNFALGLEELRHEFDALPLSVIKIDSDTVWAPGTLDGMLRTLDESPNEIGYVYTNFCYAGYLNARFPAAPFEQERLKNHNYISSNSLFRLSTLLNHELITDDKYIRLLDWCYLLKLLQHGVKGRPYESGSFTAISKIESISSQSAEEYDVKRKQVLDDFVYNYDSVGIHVK